MQVFRLWGRPAILVLLWVVLSATTAAELATIGPALRAAQFAGRDSAASRPAPAVRAREWRVRHADARTP
jgi:hypothetical protein